MFKPDGNYPLQLHGFLRDQNKIWTLSRENYEALKNVQTHTFDVEGNVVKVQFNPARMTSTSAKVDAASISTRRCFLCRENRPPEQNDFHLDEDFYVLVNPYPIFPEHFTIPLKEHLPQLIEGRIMELVRITSELTDEYVVFYNGPKCGASAPDHFHFQAGNKDFLPVFEKGGIKKEKSIWTKSLFSAEVSGIDDGLRKYILIESGSPESITAVFTHFDQAYRDFRDDDTEPLYNLVCARDGDNFRLLVLLREKHRPSYYFAEGLGQILLSPASVDVCGVCITPRQEDFYKVKEEIIKEIFNEVFISSDQLKKLEEII
ncbi:MAG: DUF4922 domain-containing protein [Ignavibacteriaceae bacterium]|nr:DUF4922 domain-containing protein [Ignavibacteriaceae bacterium]